MKTTALFLSFTLCLSPPVSMASAPEKPQVEKNQIPEDWASVQESHEGSSGKKIFFVQDAHDSLEAQKNISHLVEFFVSRGVKTVFEEGYEGLVPTDRYFSGIKDPKVKERIAYFLMDQLRLGGAEYAHINRTQDFQLIGADDLKTYRENLLQYQAASQVRSGIETDLKELDKELSRLIQKSFPRELKEQMKLRERLDRSQTGLLEYVQRVSKIFPADERKYPAISALLKLAENQSSRQMPDAKQLFQEIAQWEKDLRTRFLDDEETRRIAETYQSVQLLKRLSALEISNAEFEAVKETMGGLKTEAWASYLAKVSGKSIVLSTRWESDIRKAAGFYEIAHRRDEAVKKSLEIFLRDSKEKTAVLVFGGFHRDGIRRILQELNLSYEIISPKMPAEDPAHQAAYKMLMTAGRHPFEISILPQASRPESDIVRWESAADPRIAVRELQVMTEIGERMKTAEYYNFSRTVLTALLAESKNGKRAETRTSDLPERDEDAEGEFAEAIEELSVHAKRYAGQYKPTPMQMEFDLWNIQSLNGEVQNSLSLMHRFFLSPESAKSGPDAQLLEQIKRWSVPLFSLFLSASRIAIYEENAETRLWACQLAESYYPFILKIYSVLRDGMRLEPKERSYGMVLQEDAMIVVPASTPENAEISRELLESIDRHLNSFLFLLGEEQAPEALIKEMADLINARLNISEALLKEQSNPWNRAFALQSLERPLMFLRGPMMSRILERINQTGEEPDLRVALADEGLSSWLTTLSEIAGSLRYSEIRGETQMGDRRRDGLSQIEQVGALIRDSLSKYSPPESKADGHILPATVSTLIHKTLPRLMRDEMRESPEQALDILRLRPTEPVETILILEDHPPMIEVYDGIFPDEWMREWNVHVEIAQNREEAEHYLYDPAHPERLRQVGLILADRSLPVAYYQKRMVYAVQDGLHFVEDLRSRKLKTPVIFVSDQVLIPDGKVPENAIQSRIKHEIYPSEQSLKRFLFEVEFFIAKSRAESRISESDLIAQMRNPAIQKIPLDQTAQNKEAVAGWFSNEMTLIPSHWLWSREFKAHLQSIMLLLALRFGKSFEDFDQLAESVNLTFRLSPREGAEGGKVFALVAGEGPWTIASWESQVKEEGEKAIKVTPDSAEFALFLDQFLDKLNTLKTENPSRKEEPESSQTLNPKGRQAVLELEPPALALKNHLTEIRALLQNSGAYLPVAELENELETILKHLPSGSEAMKPGEFFEWLLLPEQEAWQPKTRHGKMKVVKFIHALRDVAAFEESADDFSLLRFDLIYRFAKALEKVLRVQTTEEFYDRQARALDTLFDVEKQIESVYYEQTALNDDEKAQLTAIRDEGLRIVDALDQNYSEYFLPGNKNGFPGVFRREVLKGLRQHMDAIGAEGVTLNPIIHFRDDLLKSVQLIGYMFGYRGKPEFGDLPNWSIQVAPDLFLAKAVRKGLKGAIRDQELLPEHFETIEGVKQKWEEMIFELQHVIDLFQSRPLEPPEDPRPEMRSLDLGKILSLSAVVRSGPQVQGFQKRKKKEKRASEESGDQVTLSPSAILYSRLDEVARLENIELPQGERRIYEETQSRDQAASVWIVPSELLRFDSIKNRILNIFPNRLPAGGIMFFAFPEGYPFPEGLEIKTGFLDSISYAYLLKPAEQASESRDESRSREIMNKRMAATLKDGEVLRFQDVFGRTAETTGITLFMDLAQVEPVLSVQEEMNRRVYTLERKTMRTAEVDSDGNIKFYRGKNVNQLFSRRRPWTSHLEKVKESYPGRRVLAAAGNGNLLFNSHLAGWKDGELIASANEPVTKRTYSSLVYYQNGSAAVEEIQYRYDDKKWTVFSLTQGREITPDVKFAIAGPRIVRDGEAVGTEEILAGISDLRWFFKLPFIASGDSEGFWAMDQMLDDEDSPNEIARQALHGEKVTLKCELFEKPIDRDQFREAMKGEKVNYIEVSPGQVKNEGEYSLEGDNVTILFRKGRYPHHLIGVRADGTVVDSQIRGQSGHIGAAIDELPAWMIARGVRDGIILDNGGDVRMVYDGEEKVGSWTGREVFTSILAFLEKPGTPFVDTISKAASSETQQDKARSGRREMRTGMKKTVFKTQWVSQDFGDSVLSISNTSGGFQTGKETRNFPSVIQVNEINDEIRDFLKDALGEQNGEMAGKNPALWIFSNGESLVGMTVIPEKGSSIWIPFVDFDRRGESTGSSDKAAAYQEVFDRAANIPGFKAEWKEIFSDSDKSDLSTHPVYVASGLYSQDESGNRLQLSYRPRFMASGGEIRWYGSLNHFQSRKSRDVPDSSAVRNQGRKMMSLGNRMFLFQDRNRSFSELHQTGSGHHLITPISGDHESVKLMLNSIFTTMSDAESSLETDVSKEAQKGRLPILPDWLFLDVRLTLRDGWMVLSLETPDQRLPVTYRSKKWSIRIEENSQMERSWKILNQELMPVPPEEAVFVMDLLHFTDLLERNQKERVLNHFPTETVVIKDWSVRLKKRAELRRTAVKNAVQDSQEKEVSLPAAGFELDRAMAQIDLSAAVLIDYTDMKGHFSSDQMAEIFAWAYLYPEKIKLLIYHADLADERLKPFRQLEREKKNVRILNQDFDQASAQAGMMAGKKGEERPRKIHLSKGSQPLKNMNELKKAGVFFFRYGQDDSKNGLLAAAYLYLNYLSVHRHLAGMDEKNGFLTLLDDQLRELVLLEKARLVVAMAA